MNNAPQVQSLADVMAQLDPAYSAQRGLIQQQQAGLGTKYATQQAGLDATKTQSFNKINTQATGRGLSFSGIPLDEQANYLSTAYLPAVANLKASQNTESSELSKQLADLYSNQYTSAFNTRNSQQSALDQWNLQRMQQEYSAAEAEKERQFNAAQNAASMAASASSQYQPLQDALNELGTSYSNAGKKQQFNTYNEKGELTGSRTREQAAYALASATGLTYEEALNAIYGKFKG